MSFTLSTSNLTDTSTSIVMTLTSDYSTSQSVSMSVQEGGSSGSTIYSTTVTIPAGATTGDRIHTPVSSLTAATTYYVATTISGGVIAADLTFTTRDTGYDTAPKVATQGQWEDLADRVQSKAEIGSVLSTPSNVAYVGANNIMNNAVTSDKIDFTTFGNQTSYFDIGNIRVAFGDTSFRIPNNTETQSSAISYGVTFGSTPKVIVQPAAWAPITMCVTAGTNTTSFKIVAKHNFGTTIGSMPFDWVAIGVKPS